MASTVQAKSETIQNFALPPLKLNNNESGMHVAMCHQSPLHGGRVGGGGSEHEASGKGKLKPECKIYANSSLENHDHVVEKYEEKQKVVGSNHVDNLNSIDSESIDKESRSKKLIKIPALKRNIGDNVVDKEGVEDILQGGGDHEPVAKNCCLRPRSSSVKKTLNFDDGAGVGSKDGEGSGSAHVADNVNDIDNMSIDEEPRSKIVIKIPALTRTINNIVVDKEGDEVIVNEQKGKDDELVTKTWNLKRRRQVKKSLDGDDGGGRGGVGSRGVQEKKDQVLQENFENGNNVVDKEEYQATLDGNKGEKILEGGEDNEPIAKIWNLRPRRQVKKSSNVDDRGGVGLKAGGSGSVQEKKDHCLQMNFENGTRVRMESRLNGFDKEKKVKFSLSLTRQEIDEDIYSFTGLKASRRPNKRPKVVQKYLDNVFPGQSLAFISPDSYKVSSMKG